MTLWSGGRLSRTPPPTAETMRRTAKANRRDEAMQRKVPARRLRDARALKKSPARTYFPDCDQYHWPRRLNGRVRKGIGCDPAGIGTEQKKVEWGGPRSELPSHELNERELRSRTIDFSDSRITGKAAWPIPLPPHVRADEVRSDANLSRPRVGKSGQADRPISTGPLNALRRLYVRPITSWSSRGLMGKTRFGVGFTLICFQRFSCPDIATRHCR